MSVNEHETIRPTNKPRATSAETMVKVLFEHNPDGVLLIDAGESYEIEINRGGETFRKTYADPARECSKRVRFAAVYVVMTLMPPELFEAEPSEPTPERAAPEARTDARAPSSVEETPKTREPEKVVTAPPSGVRHDDERESANASDADSSRGSILQFVVSTHVPVFCGVRHCPVAPRPFLDPGFG